MDSMLVICSLLNSITLVIINNEAISNLRVEQNIMIAYQGCERCDPGRNNEPSPSAALTPYQGCERCDPGRNNGPSPSAALAQGSTVERAFELTICLIKTW